MAINIKPLSKYILSAIMLLSSVVASAFCPVNNIKHLSLSEIISTDTLSDSEATDSLFIKFLSELPSDKESKTELIKKLMGKASAIPGNFILVYNIADRLLADPESDSRDDESYIMFLEEVVKSPIIAGAEKERAEYRLEMALKNRPGTKAADFSFITKKGFVSTLYETDYDNNLLLLFYDPDCDHCTATISELKSAVLPSGLSVMAIDITGDKDLWNKTKSTLPDNWISGFATDPIEDSGTYIFQTMPTLFLLDKDKKVVQKDTSIKKALEHRSS